MKSLEVGILHFISRIPTYSKLRVLLNNGQKVLKDSVSSIKTDTVTFIKYRSKTLNILCITGGFSKDLRWKKEWQYL
jgi:hypothetical protein